MHNKKINFVKAKTYRVIAGFNDPSVSAIAAQITTDHGSGDYVNDNSDVLSELTDLENLFPANFALLDIDLSGHVLVGGYKTGATPWGFKKNEDYGLFFFRMLYLDGTPATGIVPIAERALGAAGFAALTNAPDELDQGYYYIDIVAADLNSDSEVAMRFRYSGCRLVWYKIPIQGK